MTRGDAYHSLVRDRAGAAARGKVQGTSAEPGWGAAMGDLRRKCDLPMTQPRPGHGGEGRRGAVMWSCELNDRTIHTKLTQAGSLTGGGTEADTGPGT
ncbi:hypothetical protein GCM10008019_45370 [Deinococcus soli (ex Cha et al. 2016)]|nr:hypothetical protein GCM10008019_45370 [Deinococcus soli (ex Cha et al. 2016)]